MHIKCGECACLSTRWHGRMHPHHWPPRPAEPPQAGMAPPSSSSPLLVQQLASPPLTAPQLLPPSDLLPAAPPPGAPSAPQNLAHLAACCALTLPKRAATATSTDNGCPVAGCGSSRAAAHRHMPQPRSSSTPGATQRGGGRREGLGICDSGCHVRVRTGCSAAAPANHAPQQERSALPPPLSRTLWCVQRVAQHGVPQGGHVPAQLVLAPRGGEQGRRGDPAAIPAAPAPHAGAQQTSPAERGAASRSG